MSQTKVTVNVSNQGDRKCHSSNNTYENITCWCFKLLKPVWLRVSEYRVWGLVRYVRISFRIRTYMCYRMCLVFLFVLLVW